MSSCKIDFSFQLVKHDKLQAISKIKYKKIKQEPPKLMCMRNDEMNCVTK